jgi:hypothetical protein
MPITSTPIDPRTLVAAAELGVRLEIMNGLSIWEAQPRYRRHTAPAALLLECGCELEV